MDHIEFHVADSGPGVRPEERGHIFEKFYQVRSDASRKLGLGLGLAISQEVVDAHSGKIEVSESEWGGEMMRVMVPVEGSEEA